MAYGSSTVPLMTPPREGDARPLYLRARPWCERSDAELIEAARDGVPSALGALLDRYEPRLRRVCERMCSCPEDARDLAQETLIAIVRGLDGFRGDAAFMTWAYAVARSFANRQRRRTRSRARVDTAVREVVTVAIVPSVDLEGAIDRQRVYDRFERALSHLSEVDRSVLIARDIDGMTAPEVSRSLGITVSAVKSRLHRARQQVRGDLRGQPIA